MFISIFSRLTSTNSPQHGLELAVRYNPELPLFLEYLESLGDSRLRRPIAWSASEEKSTLSALWKEKSRDTRCLDEVVQEADWATRLNLALQLVNLGSLWTPESVTFLGQTEALVEGDGRCVLDTTGCLYRNVIHPHQCVEFRPGELFWVFAAGQPESLTRFFLSHWVATHVLRCLVPGHQAFEGSLVHGACAFYLRSKGMLSSDEDAGEREPSYQEPEGLPAPLASVLRRMLSFCPEEHYSSAEAALTALDEALRAASVAQEASGV